MLCYYPASLDCASPDAYAVPAGCGPPTLQVLSQRALRQHIVNCCNAIQQTITQQQEAVIKQHSGVCCPVCETSQKVARQLGSIVAAVLQHQAVEFPWTADFRFEVVVLK